MLGAKVPFLHSSKSLLLLLITHRAQIWRIQSYIVGLSKE